MTATDLIAALDCAPAEWITEYVRYRGEKTAPLVWFKRAVATAACLALILCAAHTVYRKADGRDNSYPRVSSQEEMCAYLPEGHLLTLLSYHRSVTSFLYDQNGRRLLYDADYELYINSGFYGVDFALYCCLEYDTSLEEFAEDVLPTMSDGEYTHELVSVRGNTVCVSFCDASIDPDTGERLWTLAFIVDGDLYVISYGGQDHQPVLVFLEAWFAMAELR